MKLEKVFCMGVASQLAGAVVSNLPDDLKLDVEIKDANLRAENLMAWELFRIFYHAVSKALDDEQNWPAPKASLEVARILEAAAATLLPGGVASLPAALAPLLKELLEKLKGNTSAPAGPLPNPGEARAA
jgi:hypothetical protein